MKRYVSSLSSLLPVIFTGFTVSAQLIQNSGDTVVLKSKDEKAVIVQGKSKRNNAINEMSVVSSRAFSVECNRYTMR